MILRNLFYPYSKLLWMPNCAPFAVSAREIQARPGPSAKQVCLRLTWPMTYLGRPALPSMSPICWPELRLPFLWPSIAKAWSPLSPKKSPAATAFCAPPRTPSACARRLDDSARHLPRHCRRLAPGVPPTAHLSTRRTPGSRLNGLPGTPLLVPHHLDLGRSASELGCGILSPLALPLATPGFVCPHSAPRSGLLPRSAGGCGHR